MPDLMDRCQERELIEHEAIQARARELTPKPGVKPPRARRCSRCDEPIPRGRLRALPAVTVCIDCAELNEIRDSHYMTRR